MIDFTETRIALHTAVARIRSDAQELDRECEKLEEQIAEKRALAAEDRRLANHITRAAQALAEEMDQ